MTAKENRPSDAEAAPEEFGGSEVQNTPGGTDRASQTTAEFDLEAGSPTQLVRVATTRFLKDFPNVAPEAAEQVLLGMLNKEVAEANAARKGSLSPRLATYSTLPREAVARLVASLFVVRKVRPPKSADRGMLAIYQADGPDEGIYVGRPNYLTFFRKSASLLKRDGVMLLHTIGRTDRPSANNPFIEKYIFPGGYIPALSEVMQAVEKSGLAPKPKGITAPYLI